LIVKGKENGMLYLYSAPTSTRYQAVTAFKVVTFLSPRISLVMGI